MSISTLDLQHILTHVDFSELKDKKIFITGGTGFLGKWMLESLIYANDKLNLNAKAIVLTRNIKKFTETTPYIAHNKAIILFEGDVRNYEPYIDLEYSHVIHMATDEGHRLTVKDPIEMYDIVANGTKHTLDVFCRNGMIMDRPKKILVFSSGDVFYGHNAYSEGKRVSEYLGSLYYKQYGLDIKIARGYCFVGAYLPLDRHFAIGNFINNVLKNEPILVKGDGSQIRSYMYCADATICFWNILFKGDNEPYNVGSDNSITIKELAELVASFNNSDVKILGQNGDNETQIYVPNEDCRELGLKKYLDLHEAIKRTIKWNRGK